MAYLIGLSDAARKPSTWGKVSDAAPNNGDVLTWVAGSSRWEPTASGAVVVMTGDVSGNSNANTVDKIKNVAVLAGVPSDRQMFTYDSGGTRWEAQWPGITNFSENRTFTILPAGSTIAAINTALTDYDLVYLEPGDYSIGVGETIAITSSSLIGLGSMWGGTATPKFTAAAATGANLVVLNNGVLQNVSFYAATAQIQDIIVGNTGNCTNYVEKIHVETVAACTGGAFAFSGAFVSLSTFRTFRINGVYIKGGTVGLFGPSQVNTFLIYAPPVYGITTGIGAVNSAQWITIENGRIDGTGTTGAYGIHNSGTTATTPDHHTIRNVEITTFGNAGGYGVYYNPTNIAIWTHMTGCKINGCTTGLMFVRVQLSNFSDIRINSCGAAGGSSAAYFASSVGNTWSGLDVWSTPAGGYGLYFNNTEDSVITNCKANGGARGFYIDGGFYDCAMSNCTAQSCNSTVGWHGNFIIVNAARSAFSNLASFQASNTNNSGFYFSIVAACAITGLTDFESYYGAYIVNVFADNELSNVTLYNSNQSGMASDNTVKSRNSLSNFSSYHAGTVGLSLNYWDDSTFSNFTVDTAGTDGIVFQLCNYCSGSNFSTRNNTAGRGVGFQQVVRSAFSNVQSYYDGNAGSAGLHCSSSCVELTITGGSVYQSYGTGVYVGSCSFTRIIGVVESSNRTNGYHGFYMDGSSDNAFLSCVSYNNRQHGFYTTINTNRRSQTSDCYGYLNSRESNNTYSNFYMRATGGGDGKMGDNLSVRAGVVAGKNVDPNWNEVDTVEV